MSSQGDSSFKSILQEFPTLGQAPGDYRITRNGDVRKWCENDAARWRIARIKIMISDLECTVNTLKTEIQDEEVRSGINDSTKFDYPTVATALIKRCNNAMRSIDTLRCKLAELDRVGAGEFIIP
jgi:hypothetical protein